MVNKRLIYLSKWINRINSISLLITSHKYGLQRNPEHSGIGLNDPEWPGRVNTTGNPSYTQGQNARSITKRLAKVNALFYVLQESNWPNGKSTETRSRMLPLEYTYHSWSASQEYPSVHIFIVGVRTHAPLQLSQTPYSSAIESTHLIKLNLVWPYKEGQNGRLIIISQDVS